MALQSVPRPEHPRPDQQRTDWQNLNGSWEFFETDDDDADLSTGGSFPDRIVVPFARESRLSGLARTGFINNVWYRRTFDSHLKSPRQRLHIMAADYQTRVWLNGHFLGTHMGGNTPITYEVTEYLKPKDNVLVVHCYDNPRSGLQPLGKQALTEQSEGIFYTRTTGIWQTVWLEGVGDAYIRDAHYVADADGRFELTAEIEHARPGLELECTVETDDPLVMRTSAEVTQPKVRGQAKAFTAWSVDHPQLYRGVVRLLEDGVEVDRFTTYVGFRTVEIRGHQILLNGKPVFQRLVLDQGFYPDGVWTAPSDDALRNDIVLAQQAGFNGARLHQKVFEPRFLYHAATLGYLCWGEFPNYGANHALTAIERPWIEEWVAVVRRDRSQPAIIGWCPFNETDPKAIPLQGTIVRATRLMDETRPCLETSGWSHGMPDPAILDAHDYEQRVDIFRARWVNHNGPVASLPSRYQRTPARVRPFMVSEYGGIGWATGTGWGYGSVPQTEEEFFTRLKGLTQALLDNPYHFGFVYTQLTDVEQERNGLYTFDRQPKFAVEKFAAIFGAPAAYESSEMAAPPTDEHQWDVIVGARPDGAEAPTWRMALEAPEGWMKVGFNDTTWTTARGAFGQKNGWEDLIQTPWTTPDIYLRKTFQWPADRAVGDVSLVIHFDNATQVFLNGELLWESPRAWNDRYEVFDVTDRFRQLVRTGPNTLAVHTHQDSGGQFIDLALLMKRS